MQAAASPTKRFHLVSQVLLRQFCDHRNLLTRFSLAHSSMKLVGSRAACSESRIYPDDWQDFEALWKTMEDKLPHVLDAIQSRTIFNYPPLLEVVRDCLAVHLARSYVLFGVHELATKKLRARIEQQYADDPRVIKEYRRQHHGIWPIAEECRRMVAALVDETERTSEATSYRANRLMALYPVAKKWVARGNVEIGVAGAGEFLMGDSPAQSLKSGHPGVGPLGGVPWGEATTFVMPLGRRFIVSLGRRSTYIDLDEEKVDRLNTFQIASARHQIVWHPDADFRALVHRLRPPMA